VNTACDINADFWNNGEQLNIKDYDAFLNDLIGTQAPMAGFTHDQIASFTPPDTPPSSDRSTPPAVADYSCLMSPPLSVHSILSPRSPPSEYICQPLPPTMPSHNQVNFSNNIQSPHILPLTALAATTLNNKSLQNQLILPAPCTSVKATPSARVSRHSSSSDSEQKRANAVALKEARKLRNRESARNSQQKQKETLVTLTARCAELEKENVQLKHENQSLQLKVYGLEGEILTLSSKIESGLNKMGSKRKAISMFAVVFLVCFNLAPFTGISLSDGFGVRPELQAAKIAPHSGRSLLWTEDQEVIFDDTLSSNSLQRDKREVQFQARMFNSSRSDNCGSYINQTETARLEDELLRLVARQKKSVVSKANQAKPVAQRVTAKVNVKKPLPLSRMKSWLGYSDAPENDLSLNELDLAFIDNGFKGKIKSLMDAINRRDDTFYFVSFSVQDHILLPAEANKTKIRPRFSVLMPALSTVNATNATGVNSTVSVLTMMQIDCEVMNTKMIEVRSLIDSQTGSDRIKQNVKTVISNKRAGKTTKQRRKVVDKAILLNVKHSNLTENNTTLNIN